MTVRPKLYIACGISGQIQHTAGMDGSAMVISINTDPEAPINKIADYAITGDVNEVIPKMIKYYITTYIPFKSNPYRSLPNKPPLAFRNHRDRQCASLDNTAMFNRTFLYRSP